MNLPGRLANAVETHCSHSRHVIENGIHELEEKVYVLHASGAGMSRVAIISMIDAEPPLSSFYLYAPVLQ